jgi:hypothetical protein
MRKTVFALLTLLLVFMGPAAQAAHRVGPVRHYLVDDDELAAYLELSGSLNYEASKSFKTADSVSMAVEPWKKHNKRMSCSNNVIDKIKVDVGRIGNVNPRPVVKNCKPTGVEFYIDFKNQTIWNAPSRVDRCAEVKVTIIKAHHGDIVINYPTLCLPH